MPFVPEKPDVWFQEKDWPLAHEQSYLSDGYVHFPCAAHSESGIQFTLDLDLNNERCIYRDSLMYRKCIMPMNHDTPHMPMSDELEFVIGPMMIREMFSQSLLKLLVDKA